jgi:hypothetical protein
MNIYRWNNVKHAMQELMLTMAMHTNGHMQIHGKTK